MKAHIITFHMAKNYGAILQCFALQKILSQYVDEVETIDFSTSAMKYSILPRGKGLKTTVRRILTLKDYSTIKRKHKRFEEFLQENIKLTRHYGSIDELRNDAPEADIVFTGSDQVFNPNRCPDERKAYYLDFPCRYRASYAASFGNSVISENKKDEISKCLKQFDSLAGREDYGVEIIKELSGKDDVAQTIDPVFLLSPEIWKKMEEPYPGIPEKYILFFNLRESKVTIQAAKSLMKNTGLPVVMIIGKPNPPFRSKYILRDVGPKQFLWLIDHCTYFLEDSFHATAFSLIFHKKFLFCDDHPKSYERGRSLLNLLDLPQCYNIRAVNDLIEKDVNYLKVEAILEYERQKALAYICNSINKAKITETGGLSRNHKRVGIITYTDSLNWGAQLQAYALKHSVQEYGAKAKQIDHRVMNTNFYRKGISIKTILNNLIAFANREASETRIARTISFRDCYLSMTTPCRTEKDMRSLNNQFDVFITGSDQVWNCTRGVNSNFYLDFVSDDSKKCAYAASFGVSSIADGYKSEVAYRLNKYRYITVRETAGKSIVDSISRKIADCVCDPVFLLTADQWSEVVAESSEADIPDQKYIFAYATYISKDFLSSVQIIRKQYKLPVITLTWLPRSTIVKNAGPAEFIEYIKNAEIVVTTSFHAVAFSIIFHKKLCVLPHKTTGNRVTDILNRLGGGQQIIKADWNGEVVEADYTAVDKQLEQYRIDSKAHLYRMLDEQYAPEKDTDNNISIVHAECTGCRVCEKICPKHCITMVADKSGFLYPQIDKITCISCGKCLLSCHLTVYKEQSDNVGIYGYSKNEEVRRSGSSGGAFGAIVESIHVTYPDLELRVFGSIIDTKTLDVHQMGKEYASYKDLCQSKYVISDTRNTFNEVKKALDEGIYVIYCGTPCQIGALKSFLGTKEYERICTLDFICHGTPSEKFMKEHIAYISKGKKVQSVEFRSKAKGWGLHKYCLKVNYVNGEFYLKNAGNDFYFSHFLNNDCLREGCYHCHYSLRHESDLTLGDFWEISKYMPSFDDQKGISVIFGNTQKGKQMIETLKTEMKAYDTPDNYHRSHSGCKVSQMSQRDDFLMRLDEEGIELLEKEFKRKRIQILIQKAIKKIIKE